MHHWPAIFLFSLQTLLVSAAVPRDAVPIADFEGPDYGAWKSTGTAFGSSPARGTLPNQMNVDGFQGRGLANSFHGGDASTGTLTSPPFRIERAYLRFLIGGGGHAGETCMNLKVDGRTVRTAAGPNLQPGGSERLDWAEWNVEAFRGQPAVIEIVDTATAGWGHINVDHLLQTDERLPVLLQSVRREVGLDGRYLLIPVQNGAPKRWVRLSVGGEPVHDFEVELADGEPDWWAFLETRSLPGRRAVVEIDRLREDSRALDHIRAADAVPGLNDRYDEPLRPQFHFSARRGWNNDPNGLVFHRGEYHLFYQHNPYGRLWGNMHWGHAVSRDLVHWKERPEALYPDALGTMFSGSAVVDVDNTSGLGTPGGEPPLVLFYTAAGGTSRASTGKPFTQCLAYSLDRGRTWTKYAGNPVLHELRGGNRDPKVIWHAPDRKWVMALYLDANDFALFESRDLKQWSKLSDVRIPNTSECPEFFELPLAGTGESRWVFYGGNGGYLVGRFDGRQFTPESGPHALHHGNGFYASQTYSDIPAKDGRRILIGWGQVELPGMPFNQMMTFPVELTLHPTPAGPRLRAWPVREIQGIQSRRRTLREQPLPPGANPLAGFHGGLWDLELQLAAGSASAVSLEIAGTRLTWDVARSELRCDDRKAPLPAGADGLSLRLLVDRASVEIFAQQGQVYLPMGRRQPGPDAPLILQADGGTAQLRSARVTALKSAWRR